MCGAEPLWLVLGQLQRPCNIGLGYNGLDLDCITCWMQPGSGIKLLHWTYTAGIAKGRVFLTSSFALERMAQSRKVLSH